MGAIRDLEEFIDWMACIHCKTSESSEVQGTKTKQSRTNDHEMVCGDVKSMEVSGHPPPECSRKPAAAAMLVPTPPALKLQNYHFWMA